MSFNISLNSVDGRQIAGDNNQIEYNFAFDKTPDHKGGYKVSFAYSSLFFDENPFVPQLQDIYVEVNLGVTTSYTPRANFTGTQVNRFLGVVTSDGKFFPSVQTQINPSVTTGVANIPADSATDAYTLTTDTSGSSVSVFNYNPSKQSYDALFTDNKAIYLPCKPTLNQFNVTLRRHDGTLFTAPPITPYVLLISFEAV
jgi:hypothetical protein